VYSRLARRLGRLNVKGDGRWRDLQACNCNWCATALKFMHPGIFEYLHSVDLFHRLHGTLSRHPKPPTPTPTPTPTSHTHPYGVRGLAYWKGLHGPHHVSSKRSAMRPNHGAIGASVRSSLAVNRYTLVIRWLAKVGNWPFPVSSRASPLYSSLISLFTPKEKVLPYHQTSCGHSRCCHLLLVSTVTLAIFPSDQVLSMGLVPHFPVATLG